MTTSYQSASTARESNEELYIRLCGENQERSVVETWMDVSCPLDPVKDVMRIAKLQRELEAVLKSNLSEREIAEWASMLCGGQGYSEWMADQE